MMNLCSVIGRPISLKRKQQNNGNSGNNINTQRPKLVLGSLDAKIVEELLSDAFITSTAISKKHKAPLSTVQRRRRYLENTILTRRYEIDLRKQGFRIGEMTVIPENGSSKEITDAIFSKYANHILSITVKIDGIISFAVLVYFKTTNEIHDIMAGIHSMPGVQRVKFAETVDIIRNKKSEIGKTVMRAIVR